MNIVYIIIDCLRHDHVSSYGYEFETTPNIDEVVKKGLLFENAFTCVPATDPALTSMFTGRYPKTHGIINHGPKNTARERDIFDMKGIRQLPEILKRNGFRTIAVDWLGRWHERGYDLYGCMSRGLLADAKEVTNQAIASFKGGHGRDTFLMVHYWDAHTKYNPPKGYAKNFYKEREDALQLNEVIKRIGNSKWKKYYRKCFKGAKTTDHIMAKYDGAISYIDEQVGRLMDMVSKCPKDTIVVITGDHGESMTEHDIFFTHHGLYDSTVHVPLIVSGPMLKPKREKMLVQHIDIMPSLLELLGVTRGPKLDGISFISGEPVRDRVFVEEAHTQRKIGIRTETYKYIYNIGQSECEWCCRVHGGDEELYNLLKDPFELDNIAGSEPKVLNKLREIRKQQWQ